jgi:hypothetical protein
MPRAVTKLGAIRGYCQRLPRPGFLDVRAWEACLACELVTFPPSSQGSGQQGRAELVDLVRLSLRAIDQELRRRASWRAHLGSVVRRGIAVQTRVLQMPFSLMTRAATQHHNNTQRVSRSP